MEYGHRLQKAQHLLKKYPDISFFLLPRKSRSAAQNYLLAQIKEKFVAYVDGDVVLHKNWASHCIEASKGKVNISAISGPIHDYQNIDNSLELKTSAVLIEKSALKEIGCFKPIFRSCEGVDLARRFFLRGFILQSSLKQNPCPLLGWESLSPQPLNISLSQKKRDVRSRYEKV